MITSNAATNALVTDVKWLHNLSPVTLASDTNTDSTEIDATGWGWLTYIVPVGTIAGSATVALQAREAPTAGGTYANITSAAVAAGANAANGGKTHMIQVNLNGPSRSKFHKMRVVTAGTTSSSPVAVVAVLSNSPLPANMVPITQGATINVVAPV